MKHNDGKRYFKNSSFKFWKLKIRLIKAKIPHTRFGKKTPVTKDGKNKIIKK